MKTARIKLIFYFILLEQLVGCTEPFTIETIDFENLLVVEASISSEIKHQVIKLSRSTQLERFEPVTENNAVVKIEDDQGNIFNFTQNNETREYVSNQMFKAKTAINYTLKITTEDGKDYTSNEISLSPSVEISELYAELTNINGIVGIQVFLDTYSLNERSKFFRYEFEETYKIKVPEYSDWSWEFVNFNSVIGLYEVILTPRTPEIICYSSNKSEGIIQASTNNLNENNIVRLPIQYIYKDDSILRERYSILVKQHVQSPEAYTYYKVTEELGNIESKLSQSQPGFVNGNINSNTDSNEKVIGFFEVSSVTSKRIFFNYFDFGLPFPPYFTTCNELELPANNLLKRLVETDNYQIQDYKTGGGPIPSYTIYKEICTDCTTFSSNLKPDFWED